MAVQSYLLVSTDTSDKTIYNGPLSWDGVTPYSPGPGWQLLLAADGFAQGYVYPPRPAAEVNADTIRAKAGAALAVNNTFIALASPTNAQVVAHVKRLSQECNALIRLVLGQLDDTSDT